MAPAVAQNIADKRRLVAAEVGDAHGFQLILFAARRPKPVVEPGQFCSRGTGG
jgi:hypothetical protein